VADNVYPGPDGYRPIKAFDPMTDALPTCSRAVRRSPARTALSSFSRGQQLPLRFDNTLAWSSIIGSLTAGRWYFTQFNDHAIATYGGTPVDINILTGTAATLGGSPPSADFCATVRDFVFLAQDQTVTWSGFEDRAQWTAGTNQSGSKPMLSGGPITGLAGGEYGMVLQRSQITRVSYAGPPTVWQWDVISSNIGCSSAGSIAQAGRLVFFLSDRGFMLTDGNDVKPIGAERIDRTFKEAYTRQDIDDFLYAAVDPLNNIVKWCMPGKCWNYNWQTDQWSTETWDIRAAFNGYTAGLTLEDLDAIYPDMDAMTPSLDSPEFMGGVPLLLAVSSGNVIGTMEGDTLPITFEPPNMELAQGRESRISNIRPLTDATDGMTFTITQRSRLGDTGRTASFATMQDNGDIDCRASGRYLKMVLRIAAGTTLSYFQGVDLNMLEGGGRR
jgi:hypothetical protein